MYSAFDHWAYWSQMLTVISMFSPCTQWVFGPLSPVSSHPDIDVNDITPVDTISYRNDLNWVLTSPTNAEYSK